jgi:hypothetical protein
MKGTRDEENDIQNYRKDLYNFLKKKTDLYNFLVINGLDWRFTWRSMNWTSLDMYHSNPALKNKSKFFLPCSFLVLPRSHHPSPREESNVAGGRPAEATTPAPAGNFRGGGDSPRICPPIPLAVTPRPRGRHRRRGEAVTLRRPRPRLSRRPWRGGGICAGLNTPPLRSPGHATTTGTTTTTTTTPFAKGSSHLAPTTPPVSAKGAAIWRQPAAFPRHPPAERGTAQSPPAPYSETQTTPAPSSLLYLL